MRRFRIRRRRAFALALVPVAALTAGTQYVGAKQPQAKKATVQAKNSVRYGKSLTLRGEFPDAPSQEVAIMHKNASSKEWRQAATTRTGPEAKWRAKVKPRYSGSWRAELAAPAEALTTSAAADTQSGAERVKVKSVTRVQPSSKNVVVGRKVTVKGSVKPASASRSVKVSLGGRTEKSRTNGRGRYSVRVSPSSPGIYSVKARAKGNSLSGGSKDRGKQVTAYRYAQASWYGPGFYGQRTACGQTLTSSTRGVAHKTLPCGAKVRLRYKGNTTTVRVIDRGPYAAGRDYDLTAATKSDLGFGSTGTVLSSR